MNIQRRGLSSTAALQKVFLAVTYPLKMFRHITGALRKIWIMFEVHNASKLLQQLARNV